MPHDKHMIPPEIGQGEHPRRLAWPEIAFFGEDSGKRLWLAGDTVEGFGFLCGRAAALAGERLDLARMPACTGAP